MVYVDTSAFLKLLVAEEHSTELRASLVERERWSSTLLDVEAHRAARRLSLEPAAVTEALSTVTILMPSETTFAQARTVGPDALRSLDAIHLAAALELGSDLEAVVTYDHRLAAGCEAVGTTVLAPGRSGRWWAS